MVTLAQALEHEVQENQAFINAKLGRQQPLALSQGEIRNSSAKRAETGGLASSSNQSRTLVPGNMMRHFTKNGRSHVTVGDHMQTIGRQHPGNRGKH